MYKILIKVQGSNRDMYTLYQENGVTYETEDNAALTTMYNKLLEKYAVTDVLPVHALDVKLNTKIEACKKADE